MPTVEIRRRLWREAYPRNGNVHNPTRYYRWDVIVEGRCMNTYERQREAKAAIPVLVQEYQECARAREAAPPPFPTQHNGVHRYFEDSEVVVLNNDGSAIWSGLAKMDGGLVPVAHGEDPGVVLEMTREGREALKRVRGGGSHSAKDCG